MTAIHHALPQSGTPTAIVPDRGLRPDMSE
jgi:hypothetical protein